MKKLLSIFIFCLIGLNSDLIGQPPPPPGGGQGDPPGVPIDGGLSLLLAAGIAYGGKKVYDLSKEEKDKP